MNDSTKSVPSAMIIDNIRARLAFIDHQENLKCVKMIFTHRAFKDYEKAVWEATGLVLPVPFEINHIPCTVIGDLEHHSRNLKAGDIVLVLEEVWQSL